MIADFYDYIIIGGGPAGSTLGAILAEGGRSVLILEAARFPRVTVGEIVAPTALWRVWHKLGITQEQLDDMFVRKWRGGWQSASGVCFRFEQDVHPGDDRCRPFVYNLDRGPYDLFLLNLAESKGATVCQEAKLGDVSRDENGRVNGAAFAWEGQSYNVKSRMVLDASGRVNYMGKALGLRMEHVELKSFAVFGHYVDGARATGDAEGDIRIVFGKDMWHWWAPLKNNKTSIGVVANREVYWDEYVADPEAYFEKYVPKCEYIRERIGGAHRITEIKQLPGSYTTSNFANYHFYTKNLVGDGWAIVGDAAGFIDPIFSAGLYISQCSGQWLAEQILELPADHNPTAEELAPYEAKYYQMFGKNLDHIRWFSTYYFDPKFVDYFLTVGNRAEETRQLYIDTFIAYDPDAIERFGALVERFRALGARATQIVGVKKGTAALPAAGGQP